MVSCSDCFANLKTNHDEKAGFSPAFFVAQKHQLVMKLLISIDFDMIVESIFLGGSMRKKKKILILGFTAITLSGMAIIGSQHPNLFSINSHQAKQASSKEQQLEDLKKHAKEIEDFVKSLSPKVESVQIAWDETQWDEIGNGTPKSGSQVLRVFGGFNHIQNSSWSVLVYLKDGKNGEKDLIEGIGSGSPLRVEGKLFDE